MTTTKRRTRNHDSSIAANRVDIEDIKKSSDAEMAIWTACPLLHGIIEVWDRLPLYAQQAYHDIILASV